MLNGTYILLQSPQRHEWVILFCLSNGAQWGWDVSYFNKHYNIINNGIEILKVGWMCITIDGSEFNV